MAENQIQAVRNFLSEAGIEQIVIDQLTSEKYRTEWRKAFTSKASNPLDNYEVFEFYGDAVIEPIVRDYLIRKFPEAIDQKTGTEIKTIYTSKKKQYEFSLKYGLIQVADFPPDGEDLPVDIGEDVFEAFFGCLATIGNKILEGWGYPICAKVMNYVLDQENIDPSKIEKDPKTQLKELVDQTEQWWASKSIKYVHEREGPIWYSTARLIPVRNDENTPGFELLSKVPKIQIKSRGSHRFQTDADMETASLILKELAKYGVTPEFATNIQSTVAMAKEEYLRDILARANTALALRNSRDGTNYSDPIIKKTFYGEKTSTFTIFATQRVGSLSKLVSLYSETGSATDPNLKRQTWENFISSA